MSAQESAPTSDRPSVLETLRRNRMGAVTVGLVLALLLGVALSLVSPAEPRLWFFVVVGLVVAGAVGISVRALSPERSIADMIAAFVLTGVGVHVASVAGTIASAEGPWAMVGASIGLDDALLTALVMPAVSVGLVVSGLMSAIVVGWGTRD